MNFRQWLAELYLEWCQHHMDENGTETSGMAYIMMVLFYQKLFHPSQRSNLSWGTCKQKHHMSNWTNDCQCCFIVIKACLLYQSGRFGGQLVPQVLVKLWVMQWLSTENGMHLICFSIATHFCIMWYPQSWWQLKCKLQVCWSLFHVAAESMLLVILIITSSHQAYFHVDVESTLLVIPIRYCEITTMVDHDYRAANSMTNSLKSYSSGYLPWFLSAFRSSFSRLCRRWVQLFVIGIFSIRG